ncbi:MAG TPA: AAA family ATPase, partial [Solirubrobacteraceae bacterium]|nr:AAA family ATPase [Solirubrobacteraceae bacterium]
MVSAKDLASSLSAAPLLEREREVAALSRVISSCAAGAGGFAVVEAAPGLGKTRLLAEARELARRQELQVLYGRAGELEGDFAFGVVRQLFEPLLATSPPEVRQELYAGPAALVEPLFSGHDLGQQEQAAATTFAVLHGLYWLAVNAAARRPTLIAVDDLHWADSPSLRWLLHMTRRIEAVSLAVVVATRPPERAARDRELVIELVADPAAEQVRPERLGGASVAELVRSRYGCDAEAAFVDAVADATGGNPLFVQALVDTLAREGVDPSGADVGRILALGGEAVARSVRIRVARLAGAAATLARAAAGVGDGAALRDAAAVATLPLGDAAAAADELQQGDLLRAVDPIEFSHPIVRSAMLEMLDAGERARAHRRAAEVLAASG